MKRIGIIILVVALALVGLRVFWYLASPLWTNTEVSEQIDAEQTEITLAHAGEWQGVDRFHQAEGRAEIVEVDGKHLLRFEDFQVSNGPDLYVWLTKDRAETSASVKASEYLELGVLKGNIGDQFYEFPEGVDPSEFETATIWCRRFGVLFGYAHLE